MTKKNKIDFYFLNSFFETTFLKCFLVQNGLKNNDLGCVLN